MDFKLKNKQTNKKERKQNKKQKQKQKPKNKKLTHLKVQTRIIKIAFVLHLHVH